MAEALRGSVGIGSGDSGLLVRDVDPNFMEDWQYTLPLTVMTEEDIPEDRKIKNIKFEWGNRDRMADWIDVGSTAPGTGTTLVARADTSHIRKGDTFSYDGEMIFVDGNNTSTKTLTLIRGVGGSTVRHIPANKRIKLAAYQGEEGDLAPPALYKDAGTDWNYAGKFEDSCEFTNDHIAIAQAGGRYDTNDLLSEGEKQMVRRLDEQWERMAFNSTARALLTPNTGGATEHDRAIMAGLPYYVRTNVGYCGGNGIVTWEIMNRMVSATRPFRKGDTFTLFCDSVSYKALNSWPRKYWRFAPEEKFGKNVKVFVFDEGEAHIKIAWNIGTPGRIWGLDMNHIRSRYLREHTIKRDVQANDADKRKSWGLSRKGLMVRNERSHFLLEQAFAA